MARTTKLLVQFVFCASILLSLLGTCDALFKKKEPVEKEVETPKEQNMGLVGMVGEFVFDELKSYQWYFRMMTGYWPDKEMTVMVVSIACNLIYCFSVLAGMFIFSPTTMLVYGILTFAIGPAVVLVGIGLLALILGVMALYPMLSVSVILVTWFCTTKLGQYVGTRLGLDADNDGDVDFADFLFWLKGHKATPKWMHVHVDVLYRHFQKKEKSPELEQIEELKRTVEKLGASVKQLQEDKKQQ